MVHTIKPMDKESFYYIVHLKKLYTSGHHVQDWTRVLYNIVS